MTICDVCATRVDCMLAGKCLNAPETHKYDKVEHSDGKGYTRNGSPTFYELLEQMAAIHSAKSHDYASNDNPYGNYHFAGQLSKLFDNHEDAGFLGRIGEKLYRLANLENNNKIVSNETIEDTEIDICTITALWMASRRDRRNTKSEFIIKCLACGHQGLHHNEGGCTFCECKIKGRHLYTTKKS